MEFRHNEVFKHITNYEIHSKLQTWLILLSRVLFQILRYEPKWWRSEKKYQKATTPKTQKAEWRWRRRIFSEELLPYIIQYSKLSGAGIASTSHVREPLCYCWLLEITNYVVGVSSNGIRCIPNFVKIGSRDTHLISHSLPPSEEGKSAKNRNMTT